MDVVGTDEFAGWFSALGEADAESVTRAVTVLEALGVDCPLAVKLELPFRVRISDKTPIYELSVPDKPLRVLFVEELLADLAPTDATNGGRAVLLYGYDVEAESPARGPKPVPPVAHALLAAKVYWLFRSEQAKGA